MNGIKEFLHHESSGGIFLMIATLIALIAQNSFLSEFYTSFLHTPFTISFGEFGLSKALILWVNDGLMAVFFFLIGLELKREVSEGELANPAQILLPGVAALGGIIVPALIFSAFTTGDEFGAKGWAIPTATDIAFALGILSLLGKRVPTSLKIFLMTLAIIDDLCAILIIAFFYTSELSALSLGVASVCIAGLAILNLLNARSKAAYLIIGVILWIAVLKSGVHATLAGVVAAFFIPIKPKNGSSLLRELEHDLHPWVAFMILPLFAFVNAGIALKGVGVQDIFSGVPMGIIVGLFLGKQLGVFGFSYLAIKLGFARLPDEANFKQLYGIALLCGVGFTMSLFVDSLAYADSDAFSYADKLAILLGSLFSGVTGYMWLRKSSNLAKNSNSQIE
ncbi:Na(+)/H(+) antiporter NhaA 1 [Campylobacter sp. 19-13652]|nr:Na+/H+ antiporter NhaA [Campylobacter sp. 19-13652]BCX78558.1 Na(+)/H(+) antiporter NhaA 1 [Campylobacter sp. 19-13652]